MNGRGIKSFAISALTHIFLFILLGVAALNMQKIENDDKIYEVSLLDFSAPSSVAVATEAAEESVLQDTEENNIEPSILPAKSIAPSRPITRKQSATHSDTQTHAQTAAQSQVEGQSANEGNAISETSGNSTTGEAKEETFSPPPVTNSIVSPATPPSVVSTATPEYPYSAMQNGDEGTVVVRLLLNKSGGVDEVTVSESSGHGSLDRAAVNAAKRMRFTPGLDSYGRPVRCYVYKPFKFALQ